MRPEECLYEVFRNYLYQDSASRTLGRVIRGSPRFTLTPLAGAYRWISSFV